MPTIYHSYRKQQEALFGYLEKDIKHFKYGNVENQQHKYMI